MAKEKLTSNGKPIGHVIIDIEELFDSVPDKRKKTEYNAWKQNINILIKDLNKTSGFKYYNLVK